MGDLKSIGTQAHPHRMVAALNTTALKKGILGMRRAAEKRAQKSGQLPQEIGSRTFVPKAESRVRAQGQALLNISDAKDLLTLAEDSFETVVDILEEMKGLAKTASTIEDGTVYSKSNGVGNSKSVSGERTAYGDRLKELSQEIDEIAQETDFFGTPLFGKTTTTFSFFVDADSQTRLDVSFEPNNAAEFDLAENDIAVHNNEAAAETLTRIEAAISEVTGRLNQVGHVQDRLSRKYEALKTSRSIHDANFLKVDDPDTAREQLEATKLHILDKAGEALLAQANATTNSAMRLLEMLNRAEKREPGARIYSLEYDSETAPVTPLRRIMLGHSTERPAFATFAPHDVS